jgi:hypothetical protein
MTPEEQIDLIRFMFDRWKAERRELIAYNLALEIIKSQNPQMGTTLDTLLENARKSEVVRKFAESRFEAFEELIANIGEGSLEKLAREFQEKYGSKLPIN